MGTFPLAVYTAEHGLNWNYPQGEIDFAALDACRKAFGRLPDFDAGEEGFEGVWCTPERVFVLRCQSVKGWDFRGRDATYLAVTWVPREQAATTDFEVLLRVPELCEPTHTPSPFFKATAACPPAGAIPASPILPDFRRVGAVLAGLPPNASATFRRGLRGGPVEVRVRQPAEAPHAVPPETNASPAAPAPVHAPTTSSADWCPTWLTLAACVAAWGVAVALLGLTVWRLRQAEAARDAAQRELQELKAQVQQIVPAASPFLIWFQAYRLGGETIFFNITPKNEETSHE